MPLISCQWIGSSLVACPSNQAWLSLPTASLILLKSISLQLAFLCSSTRTLALSSPRALAPSSPQRSLTSWKSFLFVEIFSSPYHLSFPALLFTSTPPESNFWSNLAFLWIILALNGSACAPTPPAAAWAASECSRAWSDWRGLSSWPSPTTAILISAWESGCQFANRSANQSGSHRRSSWARAPPASSFFFHFSGVGPSPDNYCAPVNSWPWFSTTTVSTKQSTGPCSSYSSRSIDACTPSCDCHLCTSSCLRYSWFSSSPAIAPLSHLAPTSRAFCLLLCTFFLRIGWTSSNHPSYP